MPDAAGKVIDISILTAETRAGLESLRDAAAGLVELLYDPEVGEETRERVAALLIDIGPAAVKPLVDFIQTDPRRGRTDAAAILCEIGEAAVEPLLSSFEHPDADVRSTAAFMFTALRDLEHRAEDPLIGLLDDRDELVRQSAAYALGALDCHKAVPKLIALATRPIEMPDREADPEGWTTAYPYDCCAAVDALGQLGDLRAVRPLLFVVETQGVEGPLYDEAIRALGLLRDHRAAGVVRSAFEGAPFEGQHTEALAAMHGREVLEELLELASSEDADARRGVCEQLIRLGTREAAPAVARLLVDHDESVRGPAREGLAWAVDDATAAELIAGFEDPSPDVRAWTLALLPVACAWSE